MIKAKFKCVQYDHNNKTFVSDGLKDNYNTIIIMINWYLRNCDSKFRNLSVKCVKCGLQKIARNIVLYLES